MVQAIQTLLSLFVTASILTIPALSSQVQLRDLQLPSDASAHRDAVRKIFVDSYSAYKKYAFGHDDVTPLTQSYKDSRNGWGASIIDGMSTMNVMGLDDLFNEAVNYVSGVDFSRSHTPDTVSVFETTIRYVGGLLSAYELSGKMQTVLVDKAREIADKLTYAWIDGNELPYGHLNFTTNKPEIATTNIAEAGTLALEWSILSKYTGDDKYRALAEKALQKIANLPPPLPGLAAQGLDPSNGGSFVGSFVTWGGGSDSYFEYLIKYARLTNTDNQLFADTWLTAVDTSIKALRQVSSVGGHVYLADWDSGNTKSDGSHLACFDGGNWLLGGKLANNDTIVQYALELVDACWNTYESTVTGIGPESFSWIAEGSSDSAPSSQTDFYSQHGFYITSPSYILRPEVLESNFYAYRVTGDTKYLDRAARAIDSFNKYLALPGEDSGYAGLYDVNKVDSQRIDDTESFWFAEVLKYLYLTFDDPEHISLDKYVFNTEAHPYIAPDALGMYGSGTLRRERTAPFSTKSGPLPQVSPIPGFAHRRNKRMLESMDMLNVI